MRWPNEMNRQKGEEEEEKEGMIRIDGLDGFSSIEVGEFGAIGKVLVPITRDPHSLYPSPFMMVVPSPSSSPRYLHSNDNAVVPHVYQKRSFPLPRTRDELERLVPPEFRYPIELIIMKEQEQCTSSPTVPLFSTRVDENNGISWEAGSDETVTFYLACLMLSCDPLSATLEMRNPPPARLSPVLVEWEKRSVTFGSSRINKDEVSVRSFIEFDINGNNGRKFNSDAVIELTNDGFVTIQRGGGGGQAEVETYAVDCLPRTLRRHHHHHHHPNASQTTWDPNNDDDVLLLPLIKRMESVRASHLAASSFSSSSSSRTPPSTSPPPTFSVISEQTVPDIGAFTLFSNGKVVGRFRDRTIVDVDLDEQIARIMLPSGEIRRACFPVTPSLPPALTSSSPNTSFSIFATDAELIPYLDLTRAFVRSVTATPQERREMLEMRWEAERSVTETREFLKGVLATASSSR